jgi:hypothetical protein
MVEGFERQASEHPSKRSVRMAIVCGFGDETMSSKGKSHLRFLSLTLLLFI